MNDSSTPGHAAVCFEQNFNGARGVFFGKSPFTSETPLLLAQLTGPALLTAIFHRCLSPIGQSVFVSQILAGIILGPSVLGRSDWFRERLFPVRSFYITDTFSFFGVMFFLFIIGVKTDLNLIRKSGVKAVVIGICTFSMPLLLSMVLGRIISYSVALEPTLHMSIMWIGSFQAITSFHVIVCLLADLKLMNSEIGRLAISSSMISSICGVIWIGVVFTGKLSVQSKTRAPLLIVLFIGIMVLFALCIFRPLVQWMIKHTRNANSVKESHVCAIFILVLGSAVYGEFFGMHYIFGPMILGVVVPDGPPLGSALIKKLELFITSIILPIFFVVSAARIDFSTISFRNFAVIEGLALFAFLWKIVGAILPSLYWRMPISDGLHLGLILSNQGIVEVLILERAKAIDLIDDESFSIMILSILMFTGVLAPVVKFSFKPSKKYMAGERMNIQYANPNAEIRMLACLFHEEHTPSVLNLFEASHAHPQAPISFYVIHLIEIAGRGAPALFAHHPGPRDPSIPDDSDRIINVLRFFEHENRGHMAVYPFTCISPYASMHVDVCTIAAENRVSLVILLFHKHPLIHVSEVEANAMRTVNQNMLRESPCSVGILIDRGAMHCSMSSLAQSDIYRVGVIFLGGPDDREALAYACRMGRHPHVCLTVIRLAYQNMGSSYSRDLGMDYYAINDYRNANTISKQCFYQEEMIKDSMGIISVIRRMESCFDLILVGRRHYEDSPLLVGLQDWNDFPELGILGDMLFTMDSHWKASVLVVQQASTVIDLNNSYRLRQHSLELMALNGSTRVGHPQGGDTHPV